MSKFSEWLFQKYLAWQEAQGTQQTYMDYAARLGIDRNTIVDIMLEKALPDNGDLMAIAAAEGLEAYDVLEKERPDEEVVEDIPRLGQCRPIYE